MASQMEAACIERTSVDFTEPTGKVELRANGQVILFDGFLKLYQEGRDDEEDEENRRLPQMKQGEAVKVEDAKAEQHFTEPPPRFSEASLVKKLEELGIGRPSTYAAILEKLRERNYVRMDKNRFIADDRGRILTAFMENFFAKYVEYDFTADLEEKLDVVSAGNLAWKALMREFWKDFNGAIGDIAELRIGDVIETLNEVLGAHIFPAARGWRRSAHLFGLRHRAALAAPRQSSARLSAARITMLNRLQIHAALGWRRRARRSDSRRRADCSATAPRGR